MRTLKPMRCACALSILWTVGAERPISAFADFLSHLVSKWMSTGHCHTLGVAKTLEQWVNQPFIRHSYEGIIHGWSV